MKMNDAVDLFVDDCWADGAFTSKNTERTYRAMLARHSQDVGNRDPRTIGREDCKRTLKHWPNPNSRRVARSVLVKFYDWCMEEGHRKDNPARQTKRPKKRPTTVYRLTLEEVRMLLDACRDPKERRVMYLGICAGLRRAELCGLQGRHFRRPGWIWVSKDIAKGGRERWVPVIADLEPVYNEIVNNVGDDRYVIPSSRWVNPGVNTVHANVDTKPISGHGLGKLVARVAERSGVNAHIHPHLLRHAFGDHVARYAGIRNAQFLLGHANVGTTEIYTGKPTLDDLAKAVGAMRFEVPPVPDPSEPMGLVERPLISAIAKSDGSKAFGELLVRLRGDLEPVARQLKDGLA